MAQAQAQKSKLFTLSSEQHEGATATADLVRAEMYFLKREEKWETVKPYRFRYRLPKDIPRTNISFEKFPVDIYDMRPFLPSLSLFDNGFEVASFQTQMHHADWSDPNRISSLYLPELQSFLERKLGAKHVKLLDYELRKRHPTFPISTGTDYQFAQPNTSAHIDVTEHGIRQIIQSLYPNLATEILKSRVICVTAWKLIKEAVSDWPLALCDASTVDSDRDVVSADMLYEKVVTENALVHRNSNQKWYYLSDQKESEMLLFMGADSRASVFSATPHASFYLTKGTASSPRESIDIRALVFFADIEYPTVGSWGAY